MHKFNKNERSTKDMAIKPYCFPNMAVGTVANETREAENIVFRRIDFDDSGKMRPGRYMANTNEVFEDIKTDAEKTEEQAYNEGFEKGEWDGLESVKGKFESVLKCLSESIAELERAKKELLLRTEREAVELSLAIAEKIVHHEVKINREVVLDIINAALKKVVDPKKIQIRLAPSDFKFLNDAKPHISGLEEDFEKVTFEEDKSIMDGGCVIETNLGDIDARIEKQLQAVEEAFRSEINKLGFGG